MTIRVEAKTLFLLTTRIITEEIRMQMHSSPHPGHAIRKAIEALSMSIGEFAAYIGVSRKTLSQIVNEKGRVTADMSIRISEAFGQGSSDIWFKIQNAHDFWQASQMKRKKIKPLKEAV